MYFRKRRYIHVYNGVRGKAPRSWGVFEHFYVKSNLTVCKVTFNCKLNEKMGEQDVLLGSFYRKSKICVPRVYHVEGILFCKRL